MKNSNRAKRRSTRYVDRELPNEAQAENVSAPDDSLDQEDVNRFTTHAAQTLSPAFDKHLTACPGVLYHYTSLSTLCSMFQEGLKDIPSFRFQSWRGGNIRTQNDPAEGTFHLSVDSLLAERWSTHPVWSKSLDFKGAMDDYFRNDAHKKFGVSFGEDSDSLEMWTRYGDNCAGVSIGLDATKLSKLSGPERGFGFCKVLYGENEMANLLIKVLGDHENSLTTITTSQGYIQTESAAAASLAKMVAMDLLAPFCKSSQFRGEREWRLFYSSEIDSKVHFAVRSGRLRLSRDFEIPSEECLVKSITLGARSVNDHNVELLQRWLEAFPKTKGIQVLKSQIPFVD